MRSILVCLSALLCYDLALAAHPTSMRPLVSPTVTRAEAQDYAQQLEEVAGQIAERYVRPVSRAALVRAGLTGLYEAAGPSVPPAFAADFSRASSSPAQLREFVIRVRESLGNPGPLHGPEAIQASLRSILRTLDPYCTVLTGSELDKTNSGTPGRGFGFDLEQTLASGPLTVKSVVPGGPAQKAGIRPGDQITHANNRPIQGRHADFLGEEQLRLTLQAGGQSREVTLKAETFRAETVLGVVRRPDNSWDYFLDRQHGIAHVRIASLDFGTSEELSEVLTQLEAENLRGLILDLRWCPGGYLDEARSAADLFLGNYNPACLVHPALGLLVAQLNDFLGNQCKNATVRYREGEHDQPFPRAEGNFVRFPILVLVNSETSGGAELIAAVLQDNQRAPIAGERTRGKASVQRVWRLNGEDSGMMLTRPVPRTGIKLTNGILVRPSGKNLHRFPNSRLADDWGVRPEPTLRFHVSSDLTRTLREWWRLQDLRPGWNKDSLPLDDPSNDPQRQAAWRALVDVLR
jgi:carboxyl-terminal processing protease